MEKKITEGCFKNVYGYKDVKKELTQIRGWLTNEDYLNNKDIMLPKGILFYGDPGNGKTSLLKEYAYSFNSPVFVVEGEKADKTSQELLEIFNKTKAEKFSIIVIDELDLLLDSDRRVQRILQDELDGINTTSRFLVLATTNNMYNIPSVLTRPGRFDRLIEIDDPDLDSRKELFKNFISNLNGTDNKVDYNHVAKVCGGCNGAEIKAICNDVLLRCGLDYSTEEIELSYRRIVKRDLSDNSIKFKDYRVAVHEAGHALMAINFKDNWTFYNAEFNSKGGITEVQEVDEKVDTIRKREQSIMIGLGGFVAEQIIFGKHDVGSYSDYCKANDLCERLIGRVCAQGIKNLTSANIDMERKCNSLSQVRLKKFENKVARLMKKYELKTKIYLRKHKDELKSFAAKMCNEGKVTYKAINQNLEVKFAKDSSEDLNEEQSNK